MLKCLWTLLTVLACVSGEYLMGGHLDNNARIKSEIGKIKSSSVLERKAYEDDLDLDLVAEESTVGATTSSTSTDNDVPRYHIPYPFAFNGGKPFSLEKDPITGKIDFEKAPPVRALNYTDDSYHEQENNESENNSKETGDREDSSVERDRTKGNNNNNDDVGPNEINTNTANFHDFLNLPMHYSSDKYKDDKYPLISSSYANTKVQSGANSYSTYNHRPYHEDNLYAYPVKNSYASLMKTSTHRTTTISDFKTKWASVTKPSTITTSTPSTTIHSSQIMLSTTSKAPVVTTWKPSTTPITFYSFNRTVTEENEKSTLSIEKLPAFSHMNVHKSPSNIPTQSSNDEKTIDKAQTVNHYKDQPNLTNFVLSHHTETDVKPSAPNEEYKDSYDIYESPDGEDEDENDGDSHRDGNSEENDYFIPFRESQKDVMSTSSATISNATTSTTTTTVNTVSTLLPGTSTVTTVTPSVTPSTSPQEEPFASNLPKFATVLQHPAASSSLNGDRKPSITERYDDIISHEYKSTIKSESDRLGSGVVIESTSNIVVPPDQDTVSFVLGNRQSVEGGYYSIGTAIGENPYGSSSDSKTPAWPLRNSPQDSTKDVKYDYASVSVAESDSDHATQKWWPPGSGALKNNNEVSKPTRPQNSFATIPITTVINTKNRTKEKDPGYVTFPNDETKDKDTLTEEHVIIINEADGSIRELPPKTSLTTAKTTMNKTKINLSANNVSGDLPQLAENLMPPAESSRLPPYYYHYQYDTLRTDHSRPQRLPLPSRTKPHSGLSVPPLDAGVRRRPYSPDTKLPNILPQFRPNAKASHGHRFGSDVIGTMPAGQGLSTRVRQPLQNHPSSRRPFPPPPSYLQRLNPPPPPIHAIRLAFVPTSKVDNAALPHETEPTIRKFRLPHVSSQGGVVENANRLFDAGQDESDGKKRNQDRSDIAVEHENESSERYPEEPPMIPPRPPLFPKHRTADPPRVTTLQMIQHHGEFNENEAQLTQPVEPVLAHQAERRKSDNYDSSEMADQPVYVVYPVNTAINIHPDDSKEKDDDGGVVVGTRGPHRPLPPDTLLQDEQKTQVYDSSKPVALDFPYPLEHPDSSSIFSATDTKETPLLIPSEHRQQASFATANERENGKNEQDSVNVIPYLQDFLPYQKKTEGTISATLHRTASTSATASTSTSTTTVTSTPIAYVYTPTRATAYPNHYLDDDDTDIASNDATATVLLPSQQPSSSSSSAPAPQNFMAPFVASMSAEAPNKNGWSVVVVEQPSGTNKRIDDESDDAKHSPEADTQTEKAEFDVDNFKPQLFGGFKPIYEFPTEDTVERRNTEDTNTETNMPRRSKELPVPDKG